jgi:hypothetical protein
MRLQCSIDFGEFPFYEPQELVHMAFVLSRKPQTAHAAGVLSLNLVSSLPTTAGLIIILTLVLP